MVNAWVSGHILFVNYFVIKKIEPNTSLRLDML
jgi:hypothetical protein